MKKTTILCVMAVLWPIKSKNKRARTKEKGTNLKTKLMLLMLLAIFSEPIFAQENKALDVTLNGVQIGQQVPDVNLTNLHNYKDKSGGNATIAKLSDFRGKLLILDFWATWCSPCVAMIPKMDSLQKKFGNQIQFLSVTYQNEKEVLPFLKKMETQRGKHYGLPVITSSKVLNQLFPHVYLPHYVWIDGKGVVRAISEMGFINDKTIKLALQGVFDGVVKKADPTILAKDIAQIEQRKILYSSQLSPYTEGLTSGSEFFTPDSVKGQRVELRNVPLLWFYQRAFRNEGYFNSNNTIVNVAEKERISSTQTAGSNYRNWLKQGNGWCYSVTTPLGADIFSVMQSDFANYFKAYQARIAWRNTDCLVLERTSNIDKIVSKGEQVKAEFSGFSAVLQNVPLKALIKQLSATYLQKLGMPLADDTGYDGKVDLHLSGNLSDVAELNNSLAKYDLQFMVRKKANKVLIIEDNLNFLKK